MYSVWPYARDQHGNNELPAASQSAKPAAREFDDGDTIETHVGRTNVRCCVGGPVRSLRVATVGILYSEHNTTTHHEQPHMS